MEFQYKVWREGMQMRQMGMEFEKEYVKHRLTLRSTEDQHFKLDGGAFEEFK